MNYTGIFNLNQFWGNSLPFMSGNGTSHTVASTYHNTINIGMADGSVRNMSSGVSASTWAIVYTRTPRLRSDRTGNEIGSLVTTPGCRHRRTVPDAGFALPAPRPDSVSTDEWKIHEDATHIPDPIGSVGFWFRSLLSLSWSVPGATATSEWVRERESLTDNGKPFDGKIVFMASGSDKEQKMIEVPIQEGRYEVPASRAGTKEINVFKAVA